MRFFSVVSACAAAAGVVLISGCASTQHRPAEAILADIEEVQTPRFNWDRQDDEQYVAQHRAEYEQAFDRRSDLIWELYETHPDHESVTELLPHRWWIPDDDPQRVERVRGELQAIIEEHPAGTEIGRKARHALTWIPMRDAIYGDGNVDTAMDAFEWYMSEVGYGEHDEESARLLMQMQWAFDNGSPQQIVLFERIREEFPGTAAAETAKGKMRQIAAIGKPFPMEFTCAVTGERVDMTSLSGKVVLVDFWATWCGPCIAKMPELQKLHKQYGAKGFEVVGISLDRPMEDGGLDELREFVAENEIPWPQWYLGKGWQSEFAQSWGINAIPSLFVIDAQGKLRSTNPGDDLEELIATLLDESGARAAVGTE